MPGPSSEALIYDAIRTPRGRGKASGSLHTIKPLSLVVGLVDELRARHPSLDAAFIDDIVLGIVTPVGDQGSVLPRTVALAAGLPDTVGACSSTGSADPVWRRSTHRRRRCGRDGTTWFSLAAWSRCRGARWERTAVPG
ncbi:hypothetical protein SAMN06265360_13310 [Haloechinothrix alba]|uniref:Thiolase, N-terminal domain n=1 Tax=Haloechinothrix alba TaxID=664784 RepID=A0A239AA48_9PSEU|nr:hypothetical protein SAMN06265360_13310 [Haloechinothrix alba]